MEKDLAEKAQKILFRIRDVQEKIEKLQKMQEWDLGIVTAHHKNELWIPKELQETVFMLVSAAYANELNKLENELKDL